MFSQLRRRQSRPSALHAKDNLKILTMSQYMTDIRNTSYNWDARDWLVGFSDQLNAAAQYRYDEAFPSRPSNNGSMLKQDEDEALVEMCSSLCNRTSEQNVVYYLAGMVVEQISQRVACEICIPSCLSQNRLAEDILFFAELKDYTGTALTYVNTDTFNFFLELGEIFKLNFGRVNSNLENHFLSLMSNVPASHIPDCHSVKEKLMKRFIQFRLKISRVKYGRTKRHDSRSMVI